MSRVPLFRILLCSLCLATISLQGQQNYPSTLQPLFEAAYAAHPDIPRGLLEAISWNRTHMRNVQPELEEQSCMGLPMYYGPMGLVADGKGWFSDNLNKIASYGSWSAEQLKSDPGLQILAFASALNKSMPIGADPKDPLEWSLAIRMLSELPAIEGSAAAYARDAYLYGIYREMNQAEFQEAVQSPAYQLELDQHFGAENLRILSASELQMEEGAISLDGSRYGGASMRMGGPCYEYPGVIWNEASTTNYSSRSGTSISAVTIHTMQGYYAGTISWFQNPSANVSAHYVMRSSDGQITQMVCEADKAWHVGTENSYTVGIEHEGFVSDPSWYTSLVYQVSGNLTRNICNDRSILPLRMYFKEASSGISTLGGCTKVKGHQHFPNSSHTDPGINWDWQHFYKKVNDPVSSVNLSASSGTITDPGGSSGNYGDDQRVVWVIDPVGTGSVTLTFSSFNLEANWDYLFIYDGDDIYAPQLGRWTGTSGPGSITSSGGALTVEFRTDCATTAPGFVANWTSGGGGGACGAPTGTWTGPIGWTSATMNWNPVSGADRYELSGRRAGTSSWRSLETEYTAKWVGILTTGTTYEWRVRAHCSSGWGPWSGINTFTTNTLRDANPQMAVWPNPNSGQFYIELHSPGILRVINLSGQVMHQNFYSEGIHSLQLDLVPGTYFMELNQDGEIKTKQLFVE